MIKYNQSLMARELLPNKESGSEVTGRKEGLNLANSVTGDIGNFSFMPSYHAGQLRTLAWFTHGWRMAYYEAVGSMNDLEQKRKQMLQRRNEILARIMVGMSL